MIVSGFFSAKTEAEVEGKNFSRDYSEAEGKESQTFLALKMKGLFCCPVQSQVACCLWQRKTMKSLFT